MDSPWTTLAAGIALCTGGVYLFFKLKAGICTVNETATIGFIFFCHNSIYYSF